ncbi:murein L,D-transpeptidase catalytic domain family protein [Bacteroidales bacterium OttesenSCG-928-L19]|nr:murein L,D-transpeptidase catalytic domain family protein [Bacteroidales bacterium OttesenSCG-928-L19]
MNRFILYLLFIFFPANLFIEAKIPSGDHSGILDLYLAMGLEEIVNFTAFEQAIKGYWQLDADSKDVLTLIDFSLSSSKERLFIFDMKERKLLLTSLVTHGRRSGAEMATIFSNKNGSNRSSLGFYLTGGTYQGDNGYSLVLCGLEEGFNDNAEERDVVMHGARYCSYDYIKKNGRLGRSLGCPALPYELSDTIINIIKEGTLLYIYADNANYQKKSKVLNGE